MRVSFTNGKSLRKYIIQCLFIFFQHFFSSLSICAKMPSRSSSSVVSIVPFNSSIFFCSSAAESEMYFFNSTVFARSSSLLNFGNFRINSLYFINHGLISFMSRVALFPNNLPINSLNPIVFFCFLFIF